MDREITYVWLAVACGWLAVACVWFVAGKCLRLLGTLSFRVTQLAAAVPAPQAPVKAGHPLDCPHCGGRFSQRSWRPTEGERGFCGTCLVWIQIAPPLEFPRPQEGAST